MINLEDLHFIKSMTGKNVVAGKGKLYSLNSKLEAEIKCDYHGEKTIVISKEQIEMLPKKGYAEISEDEKSITAEGIKCNIEIADRNYRRINSLDNTETKAVFEKEEWKFLLEASHAMETKSEYRPAVRGINFNQNCVCGCDGYRLSIRESEKLSEITGDIIMPAEMVKAVCKVKKFAGVSLKADKKSIAADFDNGRVIVSADNNNLKYLDYKAVIPDISDNTCSFEITGKDLYNILNKVKGQSITRISINKNLDIRVKSLNGLAEINEILETNKFKGKELEIAFNTKYLKEAVKGKENIKFYFFAPLSPVYIAWENAAELVLPVRINN